MTYLKSIFKLLLFLLDLIEGMLNNKNIFIIRIFHKISKVFTKFVTINKSDYYIKIFAL